MIYLNVILKNKNNEIKWNQSRISLYIHSVMFLVILVVTIPAFFKSIDLESEALNSKIKSERSFNNKVRMDRLNNKKIIINLFIAIDYY